MKQFSGTGLSVVFMLFLVGAFSVSARDWGFSKDTVYEWHAGHDSVSLVNSSTDTLRFDSVGLELVRPTATHFETIFYANIPQEQYYYLVNNQDMMSYGVNPKAIVLNPSQSTAMHQFTIESRAITETAKSRAAKSAAIVVGDTLVMRLIFIAHAGRGKDTLMMVGKEDVSHSSALYPERGIFSKSLPSNRVFDLRGRRMEEVPKDLRSVPVPLFSPKE